MSPIKNSKARRKRIFVVEDDPLIKDYLETVLKDAHYDVEAFTSGRQCIDKIPQVECDLILLDVMLPDMDGLSVCRALQADPKTKSIPIIMLTCLTDSSTLNAAYSHGAVDFLPKPFTQKVLKDKIRKALDQKAGVKIL